MKTYTLKLKTTSTTNYNLYDGTTLVSDTDLGTLFGSAGEAYFTFDFNSLTPTNTTSLTILDSQDTAVITNTGLSGIAEDKNFKGTWSASATAFDSFTLLTGVAMDEAQLGKLAGMIKDGGVKTLTTADYNYPTNNPTSIAPWLLDSGVYIVPIGLQFTPYYNAVTSQTYRPVVLSVASEPNQYGTNTTWIGPDGTSDSMKYGWGRFSYRPGGGIGARYVAIPDLVNNLTSSSTVDALTAEQGKVLNEHIGDLSTLTTTDKTSTVAAINEIAAASGGGITTLTSDNYNYPVDNPAYIALWLLDAGIYRIAAGTNFAPCNGYGTSGTTKTYEVVALIGNMNGAVNKSKTIILNDTLENSDGGIGWAAPVMNSGVIDNTYGPHDYTILRTGNLTSALTFSGTHGNRTPFNASGAKILNDKIGDLTTLTTTDKTSTVAAINELAARVALLEGGSN